MVDTPVHLIDDDLLGLGGFRIVSLEFPNKGKWLVAEENPQLASKRTVHVLLTSVVAR